MEAPQAYSKITLGFIIQSYKQIDGKYHCVGQQFEAGDQVDREIENGEKITIDVSKEVYFPFHMKQPN
ncbi:MAG: hypothetical protein KAS96_10120 [Planctomycetes bacterium]|nr:hypothetical protein [Planctomycetota bacterium]